MSKVNIVFINTRSSRDSLKLCLVNEELSKSNERERHRDLIMNSIYWCLINDLIQKMNASNLISILIAFVKKKCRTTSDHLNTINNKYRRKKNLTWVNNFHVNIHDSLTCWIRNEHDFMNMKKLIKKKMRCKSQW